MGQACLESFLVQRQYCRMEYTCDSGEVIPLAHAPNLLEFLPRSPAAAFDEVLNHTVSPEVLIPVTTK